MLLVDTNVIIEAVRTRLWKALTGSRQIETVEECRDETQRGNPHRPGYVTVSKDDLDRLGRIHNVTGLEVATLHANYADAMDMDKGERELLAHALSRLTAGDSLWVVCSPDKAMVRAMVKLGWEEQIHSLEALAETVGTRPSVSILTQFGKRWLSDFRTVCLLDR